MRPDLPWNVAGIPPEAREAARAAARREGLSVGEWLTRRILRSFADAGDEDELTRDSLATRTYAAQDPADVHDRETDRSARPRVAQRRRAQGRLPAHRGPAARRGQAHGHGRALPDRKQPDHEQGRDRDAHRVARAGPGVRPARHPCHRPGRPHRARRARQCAERNEGSGEGPAYRPVAARRPDHADRHAVGDADRLARRQSRSRRRTSRRGAQRRRGHRAVTSKAA